MASKREALIASAEKSLQKGKVDAALKDYLKVLEETPGDINILNKVGDLQVRLGKNDESIPFFLRIAEHYARDGFYVRAIAMYKKINKLDPARLDIYEKLAELYVKQQLWMEAKSNYQVLADYLLKQDNLAGAIGIYQKMVAIEPQNLQLHVKLADLFTQAKRIPEALREYAVVAAALSERGAHEESIRVYEKALQLAPDNVEILRTLVPLLLSINSVDQARGVLREGPRGEPALRAALPPVGRRGPRRERHGRGAQLLGQGPRGRPRERGGPRGGGADPSQGTAPGPRLVGGFPSRRRRAPARRDEEGPLHPRPDRAVRAGRGRPHQEDRRHRGRRRRRGDGAALTGPPSRSSTGRRGRLAEAADLLRLCARVAPENAEFRARLAQLEPHACVVSVAPARVPPSTIERQMEVTLSGFQGAELRVPAPPVAPVRPPPPVVPEPPPQAAPVTPARSEEFEFDLDDAEMIEEVDEAVEEEVSEAPPPTPPRGLPAPPREEARFPETAAEVEPLWNSLSAAEALEAFEARAAEAGLTPPRLGSFPGEEIGELPSSQELSPEPSAIPTATGFQGLDLGLAPPEGFGRPSAFDAAAFADLPAAPPELPDVAWTSTALPEAGPSLEGEPGGPPGFGPVSRPAAGDTALEDALVEADVFRRYGLLEKAIDQLAPWLERDPGNLRVREKLFEIHLEQGHRDEARAHAMVLADAYGAAGREDRIRGLEGLLGEALRESPVAEEEAVPSPAAPGPVEEVAVEGVAVEPEPPVEAAPAEETASAVSPGEEAPPEEAVPPEPSSAEPEFVEGFGEPLPAGSAEPAPLEAATSWVPSLEEPPTEIISASFVPPPAAPRVEPEKTVAPVGAAVPERPAAPKPKLSAEDLLGLAGKGAATGLRKPKVVRPEDLDLDLLGAKAPRPKGKPKTAPRSEVGSPRRSPPFPEETGLAAAVPGCGPGSRPRGGAGPRGAGLARAGRGRPVRGELRPFRGRVPGRRRRASRFPRDSTRASGTTLPGRALRARLLSRPGNGRRRRRAAPDPRGAFPRRSGARRPATASRGRARWLRGPSRGPSRHPLGRPRLGPRRLAREGAHGRHGARARAGGHGRARSAPAGRARSLDESGLFSDEQEFFNFADELHTELRAGGDEIAPPEEGREVSLEEIFRDFKKGVEQQLSPEDYETHYNLGIAYKEMGLIDEAIGEFQLAAKDPLHAVECCSMLGLCFLEKGLPQLAVKWYRKGLETIGIKEERPARPPVRPRRGLSSRSATGTAPTGPTSTSTARTRATATSRPHQGAEPFGPPDDASRAF